MMLAAGGWPDLGLIAVVLVGGALAAGAASALNCYIDRDIDQLMRRTKRRPLPAHSVTPRAVLIFGFTLAVISLVLMAAFTNWLATALTAAAIFYYDVVYTLWLKRRTPPEHVLGWHLRRGPGDHRLGRGDRFGGRRWAGRFLRLSSFGRCRISTRWPSSTRTTMPAPASRCSRWCARRRRVNREILLFTVLTVAASLAAWPLGLGPIYGVTARSSARSSCSRRSGWSPRSAAR